MIDTIKVIMGCVAVLAVIVWGVVCFDKNQIQKSCPKFSESSGYETKYVEYTYWNYACVAKTKGGKWIDSSLLRDISD